MPINNFTKYWPIFKILSLLDWCQDTSDLRHFGTGAKVSLVSVRHFSTGAEVSRHFGTGAEMSVRHFGTGVFGVVCAIVCCDITIASRIGVAWRLCTRRNHFNVVYLKHDGTDGTAIDWADRTASASYSRSVAAVSHVSSANMPRIVKWLNCTVSFSRDSC